MNQHNELARRSAIARILADRGDMLVVTGLGSPTYDCAAAGDHPLNFYLWGAMGSAVTVGLGLALAQAKRRVLVITGDGEMLMGLGALATVAVQEVIDGIQPCEGMETWCRDLPRFIEERTADLISAQLRRNRLKATLPHPLDSAPTALNFVAYSLARVCWYLRDGRRIERGDDADVHHYTCACYADEFVSGDERITKIVALIPQPRAKPIGMNEFAERFLSRRA